MNLIKNMLMFKPPKYNEEFILKRSENKAAYDVRNKDIPEEKAYVTGDIKKDLAYIKKRFKYPINNDVIIREITLKGDRNAFLFFYEGMIDTQIVDDNVIKAILEIPYMCEDELYKAEDEIIKRFVTHAQATPTDEMDKICEEVNFGACGLFVDGFKNAFILDVRKWGSRTIDKPQNEQSIYGPQEAFAEMLRTNTILVRKIIKTEKLIAEGVKIGDVSKTRGVILYIEGVANPNLVKEVQKRIKSIAVDYVISSEEVGMLMEENSFAMTSQIMYTERPDRAARALTEGRVVLMLNGSPHALIFPTTAFEMMRAVSDDYLRVPYANMSRMIRMVALFLSILLPGIYLSVILFHHEMIPTYLLYSISASRENVPFPSIVELLLMDISFEMIREAGIRMPSPIGSTLGIVGGLILGQSAVSAKIVSPLMIIVIAITGIGSFATPDYSLSWTSRVLRVCFIALGALLGLYGIAIGIFLYSLFLASQKSFGVPFLSPALKFGSKSMSNALIETPIWKHELRPGYLRTGKRRVESKISRNWKIKNKK
ncbi:MAG: spore germination protein [bacterium]|nr:spore germination protein [bacterium]